MYRYKNLHFRFSVDTCTSTFVTANIFPWYLLIRENFANKAVQGLRVSEANLLWLAHRPIGQPKSRISSTIVPRVRLTFFHYEFSSQDWLFAYGYTHVISASKLRVRLTYRKPSILLPVNAVGNF